MSQAKWIRPQLRRGAAACLAMPCVLALLAGAAIADPVPPEGIWYTSGDDSIIRVHPCTEDATAFCGTLVWLKEPNEADGSPKVDKLNKDPEKNGKPMVGLDILLNMGGQGLQSRRR